MPPLSSPGTVLTKLALAKKSQPAPESIRCQKCLQNGHWTYQCTNPPKYVVRQSRTSELRKRVKQREEEIKVEKLKQVVADSKKRRKNNSSSSSSSSSSDSTSSSSSSDSEAKLLKRRKKHSKKKRLSSPSSSSSSDSSDGAREADAEAE